jgi:hypothetical protein
LLQLWHFIWLLVEQKRAHQSTGLLFLGLLLINGVNAIRIRSFAMTLPTHTLFFGSFVTTFGLNVLSMLVELALLDPSPEVRLPRNLISEAYLLWCWGLMLKGYRHTFVASELPPMASKSEELFVAFEQQWLRSSKTAKRYARGHLYVHGLTVDYRPLLWALFRTFKHQILLPTLLAALGAIFAATLPLVLKALLIFL